MIISLSLKEFVVGVSIALEVLTPRVPEGVSSVAEEICVTEVVGNVPAVVVGLVSVVRVMLFSSDFVSGFSSVPVALVVVADSDTSPEPPVFVGDPGSPF